MTLLFALTVVMLADVVSGPDSGIVMVMPLQFAYTVSIAGRGCTNDEGSSQMFIIVPLIAIG